ncbi:MAG: hypothetical protein Q9212_006303, partial [Teloschistes hypoglaucus]
MTARILNSELSTIIQDSKRKNTDLRNAAEKSLADLKALPNTSDAQVSADLRRRPNFVTPFVIACSTRNVKFAASGVNGLLRLVVSGGLSPDSLKDALQAFEDCVSLVLDVQLKVLQAIPSLLQNYGNNLDGKLLASTFQLCFLLHGSKTAVVSNTAAASLQQLLSSTFEKVAAEDENPPSADHVATIALQNGSIPLHQAAADAYYLLKDICVLTEGGEPKILLGASLSSSFGLELLEIILKSHVDTLVEHKEQTYLLRTHMMPLIVKILSEKASFNLTVRAVRLLRLLLRNFISAMIDEIEMAMSLINHLLDLNTSIMWKRILCLELLKDTFDDPQLVRSIYALFDEQKDRKNLIVNHLASLVRLAAEKPALIGSGQQSSGLEAQQDFSADQIAVELAGFSGPVGTSTAESNLSRPGISTQWSTLRVPCIDHTDKAESPAIPVTYPYYLVLTCINGFSEGLSKFVLPFTTPARTKSKRERNSTHDSQNMPQPIVKEGEEPSDGTNDSRSEVQSSAQGKSSLVNPLALVDHEMYDQVRISALIMEHCWPAFLATSSTFFNASLDSENLHALIRSFQKFTQIAGLLELTTPRDALLTELAKHAVPVTAGRFMKTSNSAVSKHRGRDEDEETDSTDGEGSPGPGAPGKAQKVPRPTPTPIAPRNLLCLRALLNLGIALGPLLNASWMIILESLHQVDVVLINSDWRSVQGHWEPPKGLADRNHEGKALTTDAIGTEMRAVEAVMGRLYESTSDLPNEAFFQLLRCFKNLIYIVSGLRDELPKLSKVDISDRRHARLGSMSGLHMSDMTASKTLMLLLDSFGHIGQNNVARMSRQQASNSGWSIISELLVDHIGTPNENAEVRISAAQKLNALVNKLAVTTTPESSQEDEGLISTCLETLSAAVSSLWRSNSTTSASSCSLEIHLMELETLVSILEHCGGALQSSWNTVFLVIVSIFQNTGGPMIGDEKRHIGLHAFDPQSPKLVRSSFTSLQLICSDYMTELPERCMVMLLDTLYYFCSQDQDFNISLTSMAFFRSVSDHLRQDELFDGENESCSTESDILRFIGSDSGSVSRSIIWDYLLLHLRYLATDGRLEVRHGALHTLFGILETCGDALGVVAWRRFFRLICFELLFAVSAKYQEQENADGSRWDETCVLAVQRVSNTFMRSLKAFSGHGYFSAIWHQLLAKFGELLDAGNLGVGQAVFDSLAGILVELSGVPGFPKSALGSAWAIWQDHSPAEYKLTNKVDNQDTLTAYLRFIPQLHSMLDGGFDPVQSETVMLRLKSCIIQSTPIIYGSDVDEMSQVQRLALRNMSLISTSSSDMLIKLAKEIGSLVTMAFQVGNAKVQKGKTFVALSKAAMDVLANLVKHHCNPSENFTAPLLAIALHSLKIPIQLKYKWKTEGKGTPTWKKATSTALSILNTDLLRQCTDSAPQNAQELWTAIISISNAIAAADTEACDPEKTDILADQSFDIESFNQLQSIIIPFLGSIPNPSLHREYMHSLFTNSLIHEPHPDDLPLTPNHTLLSGLATKHIGRVQALPPTRRAKISYVLLDHLFSLVTTHDPSAAASASTTTESITLARAAAPYLILRVGVVLKAYIYDQPLRGLMPQPLSQKREMRHVLRKVVGLE